MWLSPSIILFMLSIFSSIFLVASSPSLFFSWVGLELNTLAFIPFLAGLKSKMSSESSVKYFLTQTLASVLFIFSGIILELSGGGKSFLIIFLIGMVIKLGAAPFHSWVLSIADTCTWPILFFLLTIQKVNPLLIMSNFSFDWEFLVVIFFSLVVGGFMGLAQTSVRLMLTFSSINHVGWLMTSMLFDQWAMVLYFSVYLMILSPILGVLNSSNINHINQLVSTNLNLKSKLVIFVLLLSLGGLPPFLGFLPKWFILQLVICAGMNLLGGMLILASLFTLYFYLRMSFSSMTFNSNKYVYNSTENYLSLWNSLGIAISLLGLPLIYLC